MSEVCIRIWQFNDAPQEYRELSCHGGDEDFVMVCPAAAAERYWGYPLDDVLRNPERDYALFGHTDQHVLDNGDIVVIFAHA